VNYCLYRARSDATDPELLGSFIAHGEMTRHPAPSPDGSKVAFVSGGSSITGDNAIRIFDVATRVVSSLIAQGSHPRWSPTGEQIAYISSGKRLSLVNPDGSGNRAVNGKSYGGPIAWSPDGQWILAGVSGPLELVHVATGTTIPLPYSISMAAPSWK
jgi:Tol biopolymer transport system component